MKINWLEQYKDTDLYQELIEHNIQSIKNRQSLHVIIQYR